MSFMNVVENQIINNGYINIAISGYTCSGKTTLAEEIKQLFSNEYSVTIIHQDNYFKDLNNIPKSRNGYLFESTNAFEIEEFLSDINTLFKNGFVNIPEYDISRNKRISKNKTIKIGQINIFEGLHTIKLLENIGNTLSIYLDTSIDTCLERRVERDKRNYNIDEKYIREYFNNCILPISKSYILPQRDDADIIIEKGDNAKCLLKK